MANILFDTSDGSSIFHLNTDSTLTHEEMKSPNSTTSFFSDLGYMQITDIFDLGTANRQDLLLHYYIENDDEYIYYTGMKFNLSDEVKNAITDKLYFLKVTSAGTLFEYNGVFTDFTSIAYPSIKGSITGPNNGINDDIKLFVGGGVYFCFDIDGEYWTESQYIPSNILTIIMPTHYTSNSITNPVSPTLRLSSAVSVEVYVTNITLNSAGEISLPAALNNDIKISANEFYCGNVDLREFSYLRTADTCHYPPVVSLNTGYAFNYTDMVNKGFHDYETLFFLDENTGPVITSKIYKPLDTTKKLLWFSAPDIMTKPFAEAGGRTLHYDITNEQFVVTFNVYSEINPDFVDEYTAAGYFIPRDIDFPILEIVNADKDITSFELNAQTGKITGKNSNGDTITLFDIASPYGNSYTLGTQEQEFNLTSLPVSPVYDETSKDYEYTTTEEVIIGTLPYSLNKTYTVLTSLSPQNTANNTFQFTSLNTIYGGTAGESVVATYVIGLHEFYLIVDGVTLKWRMYPQTCDYDTNGEVTYSAFTETDLFLDAYTNYLSSLKIQLIFF